MNSPISIFKPLSLSTVFVILLSGSASSQSWKDLVPLVSRCDDVKTVFGLPSCKFPETRFENADYKLEVTFKQMTDPWMVTSDTVLRVLIIFTKLPKLADLKLDLTDFAKHQEPDAPEITIFDSKKKGIYLSTQTYGQEDLYVDVLEIYPDQENAKKYSCKPK